MIPFRNVAFALIACLLSLSPGFGARLSDGTTELFSGAANCAFCHDQWGSGLTGKGGTNVSIVADWQATMMAHSSKDPFWRAVMETEVAENPALRSFIEDKCQTCHVPLVRAQAHADGTNELSFAASKKHPLHSEGVGCTLCHQILATNLATPASFTGHYEINRQRAIFGPYTDPFTMPMQRHVDYTPMHGRHIQDSALCGTCHTLFTPVLAGDGTVTGQFPEQTPYLEWRNSDYAKHGKHCQDCHLPRLDEPIKISSRPPWLEPREPFWRHQLTGGNAFMLSLLSRNSDRLTANATPGQFEPLLNATRRQLQRAAALEARARRDGQTVDLRVTVHNLTGHKFPTGHPYRRAWLHVRIKDNKGRTVFESGAPDASGHISGVTNGYSPHYDLITLPQQVQVYQTVMGDTARQTTWSLLRAANYLKDNRLPPKGFSPSQEDAANVAVRGAETDPNFHAGRNGADEVTYRFEAPPTAVSLIAEIELLYQSVPPDSVARLLKAKGVEAKAFARVYRGMDKRPECAGRVSLSL